MRGLLSKRAFVSQIIHARDMSSIHDSNLRPYQDKPVGQLLNSYAVFQLCRFKPLVSSTPILIESAKRLRLSKPFYSLIKATFFKHFCGGENLGEVIPTIDSFKKSNIGSILDLAMEADLDGHALSGVEARDAASKIALMMQESIDIASAQPGNFIALKVTAFVPPNILQGWSSALNQLKSIYLKKFGNEKIDMATLSRILEHYPSVNQSILKDIFHAADYDKDGLIDWLDFSSAMSIFNVQFAKVIVNGNKNVSLKDADFETSSLVLNELEKVCHYAREKRVRIMIDAEQTYFQAAIDDIALRLCQKYNIPVNNPTDTGLKYALIYNTYQLYLKDALDRLMADTKLARRLGYSFGVKIVRGAYMVSERERAKALSYPSPINETIEDTHKSFNSACEFLIDSVSESSSKSGIQPLRFVVASHNKDSINHVYKLLDKNPKINPSDGTVSFAQLMGMQDLTTFGLASKGVKAFKYIPYGPVEVTIPYLHRRAQENSSVLGGSGEDIKNITKELSLRFRSKK